MKQCDPIKQSVFSKTLTIAAVARPWKRYWVSVMHSSITYILHLSMWRCIRSYMESDRIITVWYVCFIRILLQDWIISNYIFSVLRNDMKRKYLWSPFSYHGAPFPNHATDCPCDVWCRGLTTCLLHVGPPFGNRFLNNSWAVGLTKWIVYLPFLYFDICNYICLDTTYIFLALSLLLKYSFFQVLMY